MHILAVLLCDCSITRSDDLHVLDDHTSNPSLLLLHSSESPYVNMIRDTYVFHRIGTGFDHIRPRIVLCVLASETGICTHLYILATQKSRMVIHCFVGLDIYLSVYVNVCSIKLSHCSWSFHICNMKLLLRDMELISAM